MAPQRYRDKDKDKEVVSSVPVRCRRLGGVMFSFIAAMSGSGISIMTWGLKTVISASMQMEDYRQIACIDNFGCFEDMYVPYYETRICQGPACA